MARNYQQGYFTPKHPEKYVGDLSKIRYMSSWELELHEFFDNNTRILRWASEMIAIPYIKPTDGKIHRYYPDYWVEYVNRRGDIVREIIECKPKQQVSAPRKTRKYSVYEQITYTINRAKWDAAIEWCHQRNMNFRIATEKSVFK